MQKIFDVVHLNGYAHGMVKCLQRDITLEDYVYTIEDGFGHQIQKYRKSRSSCTILGKIIASQDPSLKLPLLPAIEEDVDQLARNFEKQYISEHRGIIVENKRKLIDGFKAGYKSNQRVRSADDFADIIDRYLYSGMGLSNSIDFWQKAKEELKAAKAKYQDKLPTQVEAEIVDNQVVVHRWIY